MPRPIALTAFAFLAACAGAPATSNDDLKKQLHAQQATGMPREEFGRVLLQMDQSLEKYVIALSNRGVPRADEELQRLDRLLRQLVNGWQDPRKPTRDSTADNTPALMAAAADSSNKINQGIALAALGFAESSEAMPVILQGAQLDDPQLVDRAILGLAIRKDARTPPGVVIAVLENPRHPEDGRLQAAWALLTLQENSERPDAIIATWHKILDHPNDWHPLIVATAVRGIGLVRKPEDGELVARFLTHPTAAVRMAAAIALGRMNAQAQWQQLLEMLGPGETVANVRLTARKALQALAGGVDRGYDVKLWRQEFERGAKRQ